MTWTKLSDSFTDELDDANLSPEAAILHVAALCYSMRLLTDGRIRKKQAQRLYSLSDPQQAIRDLIDAGYWVELDDCYEIVNFLEDQRSAEAVRREQILKKERQARWLDKKRNPEGTATNPSANGHKKRDASQDASRDGAPAQPSPAQRKRGWDGVLPASGSPGGSPSPSHPSEKERPQPAGLIDIKTLIENNDGEPQVPFRVGRITYEIELGDSWYDDEKDRYIPDSSGIWLSTSDLDIDEADYAAEVQTRLWRYIEQQLHDRGNRSLRGVNVDDCLHFGIRTKDARYWLALLEEILVTDEVQELALAVVETAANCTFPFQVAGLEGQIRIGPDAEDDGTLIEGRTVVWAAVSAYGPGSELSSRREQLLGAIGQQVLNLIGDQRTPYKATYDIHTVAFGIPRGDESIWVEKFQEAVNADRVQELAQGVFSLKTAPEASR
jgi:hypothetical protein